MEHRQAQRVSTDITVMLHTANGDSCEGSIKNISSLGAGIVLTRGVLTRGTMVKLQVLTSSQKQGALILQSFAYVVRHNESEFGLLWVKNDELTPMFGDKHYQDRQQDQEQEVLIA